MSTASPAAGNDSRGANQDGRRWTCARVLCRALLAFGCGSLACNALLGIEEASLECSTPPCPVQTVAGTAPLDPGGGLDAGSRSAAAEVSGELSGESSAVARDGVALPVLAAPGSELGSPAAGSAGGAPGADAGAHSPGPAAVDGGAASCDPGACGGSACNTGSSACAACLCSSCQGQLAACSATLGCAEILACARGTDCLGISCFCGSVDLVTCATGGATGPCLDATLAAPGSHLPSLISPSAGPASDAALAVGTCSGERCAVACN
jgi:hypothetical protein